MQIGKRGGRRGGTVKRGGDKPFGFNAKDVCPSQIEEDAFPSMEVQPLEKKKKMAWRRWWKERGEMPAVKKFRHKKKETLIDYRKKRRA